MKTVYVPMVADCIHPGHLNIIKIASELGDVMIGLFSDKAVASYKRVPYLNYDQRKQVVENLKGVASVVKQDEKDYEPNLRKYKPDYLVHGTDWREGPLKAEREKAIKVMEEWGGSIVEPEYTKGVSSSEFHKDKFDGGISTEERIKSLSKLLTAKLVIRSIGVYDSLGAEVVENLRLINNLGLSVFFDSIYFNSAITKDSPISQADSTATMLTLNTILETTNKPVVYHVNNHTTSNELPLLIKRIKRFGISAIILDDTSNIHESITVATNARITEDFMIFILTADIGCSINRINTLLKTGINGIIINTNEQNMHLLPDFLDHYNELEGKKYLGILLKDNFLSLDSPLMEKQVNIIFYADHLYYGATNGMEIAAKRILGA
jgi:phosphoenolpyruvate phosphomutase